MFTILAYLIMALGETYSFQSLTLAPIILTIGYLVLIPSALLYRGKNIKGSYFSWLGRWPVKPKVASSGLVGPA